MYDTNTEYYVDLCLLWAVNSKNFTDIIPYMCFNSVWLVVSHWVWCSDLFDLQSENINSSSERSLAATLLLLLMLFYIYVIAADVVVVVAAAIWTKSACRCSVRVVSSNVFVYGVRVPISFD